MSCRRQWHHIGDAYEDLPQVLNLLAERADDARMQGDTSQEQRILRLIGAFVKLIDALLDHVLEIGQDRGRPMDQGASWN